MCNVNVFSPSTLAVWKNVFTVFMIYNNIVLTEEVT